MQAYIYGYTDMSVQYSNTKKQTCSNESFGPDTSACLPRESIHGTRPLNILYALCGKFMIVAWQEYLFYMVTYPWNGEGNMAGLDINIPTDNIISTGRSRYIERDSCSDMYVASTGEWEGKSSAVQMTVSFRIL